MFIKKFTAKFYVWPLFWEKKTMWLVSTESSINQGKGESLGICYLLPSCMSEYN